MEHVLRSIEARSVRLAGHDLFTKWLEDTAVDPRDKLAFAPAALDFIMGFRDFNKYYVVYPDPRDELEASLNAHAREDETHSALFLQDWAALGMDDRLGWAPRDLLWWLTCGETRASRRADFALMAMVYANPDPRLRFAIVESMEAAGRVFFTRTCPIADALHDRTGREYPYFGKYHFDRETGHLQDGDERPFLASRLDPVDRAKALALVDAVFAIFELHFAEWERLARAAHDRRWTYSPAEDARLTGAKLRGDRPVDVSRFMSLDHPADATGEAAELIRLRTEAYESLWQAPAYKWVREAWPGDFRAMVRYFLLQWVVDNWACADYFTFDTTYSRPSSPLERGINRLSLLYASEMSRRYVEWETLQFDEYTGWTATEALRHYWLDESVETHRAIFADLRKLTLRHPAPLHRYWIMKCFVRFGDTLMRSLGVAMNQAAERDEDFITFAGYPERLHPDLPVDPEADAAIAALERQPLSGEDVVVLRGIVEELRRQEAARADVTWKIVEDKRYDALHRRWMVKSSRLLRAARRPDDAGEAPPSSRSADRSVSGRSGAAGP